MAGLKQVSRESTGRLAREKLLVGGWESQQHCAPKYLTAARQTAQSHSNYVDKSIVNYNEKKMLVGTEKKKKKNTAGKAAF